MGPFPEPSSSPGVAHGPEHLARDTMARLLVLLGRVRGGRSDAATQPSG